MSSNKKVKQQKPRSNKSNAIALPSSASTLATNHLKELFDAVPPARLKKELLDVFLIFLEHEQCTSRQLHTDSERLLYAVSFS